MSALTLIIAAIALLIILFILGVPVVVAFLICNLIGMVLLGGTQAIGMVANSMYTTSTTTALVTIPLFLLVGEILGRGRAIEAMFNAVDTLIGRLRGRQYVLAIVLSTIFGALSGTAMGVAAMLGRSVLPSMQERHYDTRLSAGVIMAGASLAPIIPPSVLVIIIGTLAGVSIAGLMVAGILPGLLLAFLFLLYIAYRVMRDPALAPQAESRDDNEHGTIARAILNLLPASFVVLSIVGLILAGIATPSEAAATGVIGAIITVAIYGGLSLQMLGTSLRSAAYTAGMILVIMVASKVFSQLLAFTGATGVITSTVASLNLPSPLMLVLLLALPFALCMFIDQIALMMIIIPIYKPIVATLGFDPVWFWLLFLINITVGGVTPPFGYTIFALKGSAPAIELSDLYRAAWPFVGLFIIGMVVMALFPSLVTLLPALL